MRHNAALCLYILASWILHLSHGVTYEPNSICHYLTYSTNGDDTPTLEGDAMGGIATYSDIGVDADVDPAVIGVFNIPDQRIFYNGTYGTANMYTNLGARNNLYNNQISEISRQFLCLSDSRYPPPTRTVKEIHRNMPITSRLLNETIGEIISAFIRKRLPMTTVGPAGYYAYLIAWGKQFGRGSAAEICNQADCDAYLDFAEFYGGFDVSSARVWLNKAGTNSIILGRGGAAHWNMGNLTANVHNVWQTDSAYVPIVSGSFFSSGATGATRTFTHVFSDLGVYYFATTNSDASPTMRGTVTVVQASPCAAAQFGDLNTPLTSGLGFQCRDCMAGTYNALAGYTGTACTACAAGTFSSSTGETACISCPPGFSSPPNSTNCPLHSSSAGIQSSSAGPAPSSTAPSLLSSTGTQTPNTAAAEGEQGQTSLTTTLAIVLFCVVVVAF